MTGVFFPERSDTRGLSAPGWKQKLFFGVLLGLGFPGWVAAGPEKRYTNPLGMEFVRISPGVFAMGSPPDEQYRSSSEIRHRVELSEAFYMMTTEVTLQQWWAVMGKRWIGRRKGLPEMPVVKVSWFDCMRFINKLNDAHPGVYRLPTEAQWEYACRAETRTAFHWGDQITCDQALFGNNSAKAPECMVHFRVRGFPPDQAAPVKSYPPNAWGLYDMHGNVWEWCQDWYGEYPAASVKDPMGPDTGIGKVRRGGSFFGRSDLCRSANRAHAHPAGRLKTTGFRLVWSPVGEKMRYAEEPPWNRDEAPDGP